MQGDGHLLICDNKHKALLSLAPDGTLSVLADSFEGQPLNSLNDLTVDARGNIYWTNPGGSSLAHPTGAIFRLRPMAPCRGSATPSPFPTAWTWIPPAGFST